MHSRMALSAVLMLSAASMLAQPANDDCTNAIFLDDVSNWCSNAGAYTNVGATDSGINPSCFPNNSLDVWFAFTAEATTVNITVTGAVSINAGGTLSNPQFSLYSGDCGNLTQVECANDAIGTNTIGAFASNLNIGSTYYIQVSGRLGQTGTFKLCVNNFNQAQAPSGDCSTAVVLCDKDPFTVDFVVGEGANPNEIFDEGCGCGIVEDNSSWYKWTCEESGTLTFTLTPLNPADDLDFVIFELPNGVNDCSEKTPLRCMASGENVGSPLSEWQPCTGSTGLALNDGDTSESCGCQPGDNNFVQAIDMEAGKSYALIINNFSGSGDGFSIEFGGTGTFRGPVADFTISTDTVCVGEPATFTDASTFEGVISGRRWTFGAAANPASISGTGPHQVSYNRPGLKSIVLQIETDDGCIVTAVGNIYVECCDDHFDVSAVPTPLSCPNSSDGAIDLSVSSDFSPYTFSWSNGQTVEDLAGLGRGNYDVTITDASTCQTEFTVTIGGPPEFEVDTLIGMPTCNGGMDGSITLQVSGASPPYEYSWRGQPFSNDNSIQGLPIGDYNVTIRDINGCELDLTIPVRELELVLDPNVANIIDPSCTGFSDGMITVAIGNGQPAYLYDFNDGNGFVDENVLNNLPAGAYTVDVQDANLCRGSFTFDLEDPPLLQASFELQGISCFGENDGILTALPTGGVGGYSYLWSGGQSTATLSNLGPGTYSVTVTDANGCVTEADTSFNQPPELFIELDTVINALCFGEPTGSIIVLGSGGVPDYEFSAGGQVFQIGGTFNGLMAGTYELTIIDANGCTNSISATITQPRELIVNAGPDETIELGYFANLRAVANDLSVSYTWEPPDSLSCTECQSPQANPVNTTPYTVTATDANGCTATDEVVVLVLKNRPVYIPNAFSPNEDGRNDRFTVYAGPGARQVLALKIFNRWGGLVFENYNFQPNDPSLGWDGFFKGEPAQMGVYAFFAEVEFIDGISIIYEGDLSLVR
ncbi:MAG: gliding motility-associated C-terminal domain-containing protein [Phaeodactylibacter sp.]|nr:gliding motility-associated C-terminal domain-containing protein [Phaeodactylibacter sp.]